jgi:hypothetical protein
VAEALPALGPLAGLVEAGAEAGAGAGVGAGATAAGGAAGALAVLAWQGWMGRGDPQKNGKRARLSRMFAQPSSEPRAPPAHA